MKSRSENLLKKMRKRRSVRRFSSKKIPLAVIKNCLAAAASAPSGADMQPWTFVLVKNRAFKKKIRIAAEKNEFLFYSKIAGHEWKEALKPIKTGIKKEFLEEVPYLICVFVQMRGKDSSGKTVKHYYPLESAGIAVGILISFLHLLGISALTYTPAPMDFIKKLLKRPDNERPFMIVAAGYPSKDYKPPILNKKKEKDYLIVI